MPRLITDRAVRVTVRLPSTLRKKMKATAVARGITLEALVEKALELELARDGTGGDDETMAWGPAMAQRFLDWLPTPAVIKDTFARILWCNLAYEDIVGTPRANLLGHRITETGLLDNGSAARIARDIDELRKSTGRTAAIEFWEPVIFLARSRKTTILRSYRFVFSASGKRYLGDISFDWNQIAPGVLNPRTDDFIARLKSAVVTPRVQQLLPAFLSSCPVALAVKNYDSKLLWCNDVYEQLAGRALEQLRGNTAQTIFGLDDEDALVQNEHTVLHANAWMYTTEVLPQRNPRTSLRFRVSSGDPRHHLLGVVSAEFREEDSRSQRFIRRPKTKRR